MIDENVIEKKVGANFSAPSLLFGDKSGSVTTPGLRT